MNIFKADISNLFATVSQDISKSASVRFVLHKDHASDKWNVFKKIGFYEEFIDSFTELSAAQDFCSINNGVTDATKGRS